MVSPFMTLPQIAATTDIHVLATVKAIPNPCYVLMDSLPSC